MTERIQPPSRRLSPEQLGEVISVWEASRSRYPGWIIAPHSIRETLGNFTYNWIASIHGAIAEANLAQRVEALFELSWRLRVCLAPIPRPMLELARQAAEDAWRSMNKESPEPPIQTYHQGAFPEWLRPKAVSLAIEILRHAREQSDRMTFAMWATRLHAVRISGLHVSDHVQYQGCLFGLSRLARNDCLEVASNWQPEIGDPFWMIRKAAILAELDDVETALNIATAGLVAIRASLRPQGDDIGTLSREGWAMRLVAALQMAAGDGSVPTSDWRGRWDVLTQFGCNPIPELRLLDSMVKVPTETKPLYKVRQGFDPGEGSVSIRYDAPTYRATSSMQASRLAEEAGLPPMAQNVVVMRDVLLAASRNLEKEDPNLALALKLRCLDRNAVDKHFTRSSIALLTDDEVRRLSSVLLETLETFRNTLGMPGLEDTGMLDERLSVVIELASRLSVRMTEDELDRILDSALDIYARAGTFPFRLLGPELEMLCRRLAAVVSPERIVRRIPDILSLPLSDRAIGESDGWPEIALSLLGTMRMGSVERTPALASAIERLLDSLARDRGTVRVRTMLRLFGLYSQGVLSEDENIRWGHELWRYTDTRGLPIETGLSWPVYPHLPAPDRSRMLEEIRLFAGTLSLPRILNVGVNEKGEQYERMALGGDGAWPLRDMVAATRLQQGRDSSEGLPWTSDDVARIFKMIDTWWADEGRSIVAGGHGAIVRQSVTQRLYGVLSALREIVIPRLTSSDEISPRVVELIDELSASSYEVAGTAPEILRLSPTRKPSLMQSIRRGIASSDARFADGAISAAEAWIREHRAEGLPVGPDPSLIDDICSVVRFRKRPGLRVAMTALASLVELRFVTLSTDQVQIVLAGLGNLLGELHYGIGSEWERDEAKDSPVDSVPSERAAAARLATVLHRTLNVDDSWIDKWLDEARHDPLPEVRAAVDLPD